MMEEIAKYGTHNNKASMPIGRSQIAGWKTVLLEYAITPIQQYSYTVGKNSSDSAMIIDAMDLLYSDKVDGFCIVSSDSDFTRLAIRLRESGMKVIGMGRKNTIPLLLPVIVLFISKFWMVPFRKSKKTVKYYRHKKTSWKNG
jgi:uncharacterized LabA/DUF88 family protein